MYLQMNILFFFVFNLYTVNVNGQTHNWEQKLNYVDHQMSYDLLLYQPNDKIWEAIVVTHTTKKNNRDTTYLHIQNDLGMLLGEFTFYTENSMTFLKYEFDHHNVTEVTQVFNVSKKNPEPVEFYWHPKSE